MLTVQVHKDFTEYKPKLFGGLSTRSIVCLGVAGACSAAFGAFCILVLGIDPGSLSFLIWFAAIPAALIGFYRPHGMDFEKFVPLWWRHEFDEKPVLYVSASHRGEARTAREEAATARRASAQAARVKKLDAALKRRGAESWEPGGQLPAFGSPTMKEE